MSRRERVLARFAPITEKSGIDRRMRIAVLRARRSSRVGKEFTTQQAFDKAIAQLVRATPVSTEIAEWFRNEKLIPQHKRRWRKIVRNPAFISAVLALIVIAGIITSHVMERMRDFPGSGTARKLLSVASATRMDQIERMETEAGALGDFFFMKFRLEHYDVPPEFASLRTSGWRVFDDEQALRVAQITVPERRMQFFLFPALRSPKDRKPPHLEGWRFVEQEGWTGAVQVRDGICFMAALRGEQKDFAPYLSGASGEGGTGGSGR